MKTQILFVDDERNVLDGLQRMLRVFRNEWDMHFAQSGQEALEIMAAKPTDIVVSDMRMPGMTGAELLVEVMKHYPETIRIVLSGHADQDLIMKSVAVAHQYLAKPCDAETFKATVMRATQLRALLADANLKHLVSQMGRLPSVPSLYLELKQELQSPEASIHKISRIISRDPAMTAKILQLSNSAFFARRREISDPVDAVSYLGLDCIQHLFLSVQAFSQFESAECSGLSIDGLWQHSVAVATLSKKISKMEHADQRVTEASFTAGLLHDIGKLLLASRLPNNYREAVARSQTQKVPLWQAEGEAMCASHAEVGAYLLGLWNLPEPIVEAVAYHHKPAQLSHKGFCPLTALYAANSMILNGCTSPEGGVSTDYLTSLGLQNRLPIWQACLQEVAVDHKGAAGASELARESTKPGALA